MCENVGGAFPPFRQFNYRNNYRNKRPCKLGFGIVPVLTDSKIKAAIKTFALSNQRSMELVADGRRGAGRLVLSMRRYTVKAKAGDTNVSKKFAVEWYARFHTLGGKRKVLKIGNYPDMTLAQATQTFGETYSPKIARGEAVPKGIKELRREAKAKPTVKALFDAYHAELVARGAASATNVKNAFKVVLKTIDPDKAPGDVTPDEYRAVLAEIYKRGARTQASSTRSHVSAAYSFGMKSVNSYTNDEAGIDWGITINPISLIPRDAGASKPGMRCLSTAELAHFWHWCNARTGLQEEPAAAAKLLMATGQRPNEILALGTPEANSKGHYLKDEGLLTWKTTKNKLPHCIPLPATAKRIMDKLFVHPNGLYFPPRYRRTMNATKTAKMITHLIVRYLKDQPDVPHFTARDLRRTWKTLAGRAGLSKDIRDRIQNHAKADVSSLHYDRYDYLEEKRAAMKKWDAFLAKILLRPAGGGAAEGPSDAGDARAA